MNNMSINSVKNDLIDIIILFCLWCLQIYKLIDIKCEKYSGELMPVNFLTEEQESKYGKFCGEPNEIQLGE